MSSLRFRISSLLWLTLCVACFFGGKVWEWNYRKKPSISRGMMLRRLTSSAGVERLEMPDGTTWFRAVYNGTPAGTLKFYTEQGEEITIKAKAQALPR